MDAHGSSTGNMRCRVLIVDDEPAIIYLLEHLLTDAGMVVHTADNGADALSRLSEYPVDVVLSDIFMNGINGLELSTRIARLDNSIKVVLMTGHDSYEMVRASAHAASIHAGA